MDNPFFEHHFLYRIRYGETDQMKYVYHGNYPFFFEIGRVEAIRSLGMSYKDFENTGIVMPVMQMDIKFIRPAFYDDLLTIKTFIEKYPEDEQTLIFTHEIVNEQGKLLTTATIKLCYLDANTNKRVSMPPIIKELLQKK